MRDTIRGNGNVRKMNRDIKSFAELDISSALEVHFRQDSALSLTIEADENLQEYIIVRNDGDRLEIHTESGYNVDPSFGSRVRIYVTAPSVESIRISGASNLISDATITVNNLSIDLSGASEADLDIRSPETDLDISGASSAKLRGETRNLTVSGSGASHARCFDFRSENVSVDVSGATSAEVYASVNVNASASGASKVRYRGGGKVETSKSSGASSIDKAD